MSDENDLPSILKSAVFLVGGITAYFIWAKAWDRKLANEELSVEPTESESNNPEVSDETVNIEETVNSEEPTKSEETNDSQNRESRRAKSSQKNNKDTEEPYYQKFKHDNASK